MTTGLVDFDARISMAKKLLLVIAQDYPDVSFGEVVVTIADSLVLFAISSTKDQERAGSALTVIKDTVTAVLDGHIAESGGSTIAITSPEQFQSHVNLGLSKAIQGRVDAADVCRVLTASIINTVFSMAVHGNERALIEKIRLIVSHDLDTAAARIANKPVGAAHA